MTLLQWTPCQTVPAAVLVSAKVSIQYTSYSPFPSLPNQRHVGFEFLLGLTRELCAIKHIDLARHGLCREQVRILWHVPRTVDFALVGDALSDRYTRLRRKCMSTELATLVVIICAIEVRSVARGVCRGRPLRQTDFCNL